MVNVEPGGSSPFGKAAWLLLILSAGLAAYFGLSSLLLPFVGAPNLYTGIERWIVPAAGALQLMAAAVAFVLIGRRDLRGATLAVAACWMLGWLGMLPSVIRNGLDLDAEARRTLVYFIALLVIAVSAAALAWRNRHPILAAFIVTAPTAAGVLFTLAFAIMIAMYGF
ncbi:conserved membrane hypothetical protein [Bosea sp. 62]|uniref:hypothetical protein n=1 Tax=unclassified Bosea (in: a-proteobacteria) TaxID=2653178 RepID=UPI00125ABDE1|nr:MULTISPECIES: hypothetical protein [unclassified Bosea (in: a-proteobacteria)]CAD5253541.1 conserved membrane hypothetical protein [Bosea sp. 7B]CAD5277719.1 conserved membrane hypothetical protein [Bosea sp. 21B]CAD5278748.1 conserved membrane hypothetical protein [Bosea sp. 46]VVT59738.1 conserved membrane hypothetical protein [Bosea sp. EC-HK365B]VXB41508.1 conserved membrane hypothetical protein [Bosea sp. 62]